MKGKTLLSLAIVLAMVIAVLPLSIVKAVSPVTIAVVFENGLNTIEKAPCNNFIVSIKIVNPPDNPPGIGFFDVGIHWDSSMLELQTGTSADVVEGDYMKHFGGTVFPGPSVIHIDNMPDIPCGFLSGGPAHGDFGTNTLFTVAFHAKASGITDAAIGIIDPNTVTYLLNADLSAVVNIDAVINGTVHIPPPAATSPKAIITSPLDASTVTVGDTVTLDGSHSTDGIDSVPPSEACPINSWVWTVDYGNGTIITLLGAHASFVCGGPGSVAITLTVTAPDPTPGDSNYVDHDSKTIHIMQIPAVTGPNIDVYTDRGGLGPLGAYPTGWSDAYGPQEEVCVYAKVTFNGAPVEYKPVSFVIADPFGVERESRTAFTNASGIAKVCFRIPWQGSDAETYFGNWTIYGTVDISQVQVYDAVKFRFGYLLSITSINILNGPFHKLDTMYINVTITSIAMRDYPAFVQISVVDTSDVPIGLATDVISVPGGGIVWGNVITTNYYTVAIPSWAYVGQGTVYADLLGMGDPAPSWASVPYCPEVSTPFLIVYP